MTYKYFLKKKLNLEMQKKTITNPFKYLHIESLRIAKPSFLGT